KRWRTGRQAAGEVTGGASRKYAECPLMTIRYLYRSIQIKRLTAYRAMPRLPASIETGGGTGPLMPGQPDDSASRRPGAKSCGDLRVCRKMVAMPPRVARDADAVGLPACPATPMGLSSPESTVNLAERIAAPRHPLPRATDAMRPAAEAV